MAVFGDGDRRGVASPRLRSRYAHALHARAVQSKASTFGATGRRSPSHARPGLEQGCARKGLLPAPVQMAVERLGIVVRPTRIDRGENGLARLTRPRDACLTVSVVWLPALPDEARPYRQRGGHMLALWVRIRVKAEECERFPRARPIPSIPSRRAGAFGLSPRRTTRTAVAAAPRGPPSRHNHASRGAPLSPRRPDGVARGCAHLLAHQACGTLRQ